MNLINKPKHYIGKFGLEVNDVLKNFLPRYKDPYLAHLIANAIEYLLRAPFKNGLQDIKKALYNLELAVEYSQEVLDDDLNEVA